MTTLFDAANRQLMLLILLSSGMSVGGQVLMKVALGRVANATDLSTLQLLTTLARVPHIYAGLILYGLSMVIFFKLLASASLLTVGFSLAIGYVMLVAFAHAFLGETLLPIQWLGALLIVAGVLILNVR